MKPWILLPGRTDTWVRADHIVTIEYLDEDSAAKARVTMLNRHSVLTSLTAEEILAKLETKEPKK